MKFPFCFQIENAMFLNKVKEQQEKNASFPHPSASHYQTALLTIPTSGAKTDGGGQSSGPPHHPPHSNQNMLPVPSTGIMTAGELVPELPLSPGQSPLHLPIHFHWLAVKAVSREEKVLLVVKRGSCEISLEMTSVLLGNKHWPITQSASVISLDIFDMAGVSPNEVYLLTYYNFHSFSSLQYHNAKTRCWNKLTYIDSDSGWTTSFSSCRWELVAASRPTGLHCLSAEDGFGSC